MTERRDTPRHSEGTDLMELAKAAGAVSYSPPPMRAVRGLSFTYEQLDEFVMAVLRSVAPSETARSEGYPGIAHDLETMRTALRSIAIVDDADCAHASDPEAMKKIARDALRGVK